MLSSSAQLLQLTKERQHLTVRRKVRWCRAMPFQHFHKVNVIFKTARISIPMTRVFGRYPRVRQICPQMEKLFFLEILKVNWGRAKATNHRGTFTCGRCRYLLALLDPITTRPLPDLATALICLCDLSVHIHGYLSICMAFTGASGLFPLLGHLHHVRFNLIDSHRFCTATLWMYIIAWHTLFVVDKNVIWHFFVITAMGHFRCTKVAYQLYELNRHRSFALRNPQSPTSITKYRTDHLKVLRWVVAIIEIRQGTSISQISRQINSIWDQICPSLGYMYFQRSRNVRIRIRSYSEITIPSGKFSNINTLRPLNFFFNQWLSCFFG